VIRHIVAYRFKPEVTPEQAAAVVAAMDELLVLDPGRYDFAFHKGNSLRSLGRHEEAISAIEVAIASDPGNPLYRNHKAQSLKLLGREAEAQVELAAIGQPPAARAS